MAFVYLHTHSIYSDGINTPEENVKMAAANGVAVMAATDHDNLDGVAEARVAGEKYGVKVISGVEISAAFHEKIIHILGLGVPADNVRFNEFLKNVFAARREKIISKIKTIGANFAAAGKAPILIDEFVASQGRYFNREKAARYLKDNGYVNSSEEGFKLIVNTPSGVENFADAAAAIKEIHLAGGTAVIAHPFARSCSLRKINPDPSAQEQMLKELVGLGMDGLECYQSEYGEEETAFALALAEKYGLLVSAGSDWHGDPAVLGWDIKNLKKNYPNHIGGLQTGEAQVLPLLKRLGAGN
jgi:predicted metal-dependent phosphoesterase TrpH